MTRREWEEEKVMKCGGLAREIEVLERKRPGTSGKALRALNEEVGDLQREYDLAMSETYQEALADYQYDKWKETREENQA